MVPANEPTSVADDRPTLRVLRLSYGFTVRDVEALTGVSNSTIARIENSEDPEYLARVVARWGKFKESTFAKIARGLDVKCSDIRWPCEGSDSRLGATAGDKHNRCNASSHVRPCSGCHIALPSAASPEVLLCDDCI